MQCLPRHLIHHGHRTFHSMNLSIQNTRISNRPTEAASTATSPTDHCIPCMPRHHTPTSPSNATATRIAIPSLFQSHQYNTRPVLFRVHSAVQLKRCWQLHLQQRCSRGLPRSLITRPRVPPSARVTMCTIRAHNLLRNHGRRELISLYQSDC